MRYRRQFLSGVTPLYITGTPAMEEMWDDPDFSRRSSFKPLIVKKVRLVSNMNQSGIVYWMNHDTNEWEIHGTIGDPEGCAYHSPYGIHGNISTGYPDCEIPTVDFYKALEKYGKSDSNIGVFLAELRDTVRLFHRPWQIANFIRKGRLPKGIRLLKDAVNYISGAYMEYRYGWRPFLSDVRAFSKLSQRLDEHMTSGIKGTMGVFKTSSSKSGSSTSNRGGDCSWTRECYTSRNSLTITRTRSMFSHVNSNPSAQSASVANNFANFFRLADVASIAWELIPYSFVVDWFIPIGDNIAKLTDSPARLISVGTPWSCEKIKSVYVISNSGASGPDYKVDTSYGFTLEVTDVTRGQSSFPPNPTELSGYQIADLVIMAGQKLGPFLGKSFR